jgi:NAD(P)H-hydrate epimerase
MRVSTAREMAAIDRETIAAGVPGEELMERAGRVMSEFLLDFLDAAGHDHDHHACGADHAHEPDAGILVICGKGNNGGDGLVIARLLADQGCTVNILMLAAAEALTGDARLNYDRLPAAVGVVHPDEGQWVASFVELAESVDVVVDAIFGTGITPPLRPGHASLIRAINDAGVPCFAVDIPSGVNGDDGKVDPVAVAADLTVTVGLPKRGLLLAPGRDFVGDLAVADIGFSEEVCRRQTPDLHWLPREAYLGLLPPRPGNVHKYNCGSILIVAGSRSFGGAAHLAGMGALRSGAGLITLAVPRGLETSIRTGLPEAVVAALAETDAGTLAPVSPEATDALLAGRRALAIGPGLGSHPDTDRWIVDLLAQRDVPVVVDADGLNAFARLDREPRFASACAVLTPHAGELGRLPGVDAAMLKERPLDVVGELARRWRVVLMLKGSPSLIGAPDGRVFINPNGDDALARGGSGDVLTGLIGGLLAQGSEPLAAALLGAYLHGAAGTLAAAGRSTRSVLVREIAAAIGPVFEEMEKEASSLAPLREKIWPIVTDGDEA